MALISVIIPAYCAAPYLRDSIESALKQTHRSLEIIIVDDGSTDETAQIAQAYVGRDSRVRLLRQPNMGVGVARNAGIRAARGEFIAPLDADDLWYPDKIAKQLSFLEAKGDDWGFAYCWSKSLNEEGILSEPFDLWTCEGNIVRNLVFQNVVANASVPLFRVSALKRVGLYLTRAEQGGAQGCEDWDLLLKVASCYKAGGVAEFLVQYRQTPGSMTTQVLDMARSYECMIRRLRARDPRFHPEILRWSAGHFYAYLLRISFAAGFTTPTLKLFSKAIGSDPVVLLDPIVPRVAVIAMLRMLGLKRRRSPGSNGSANNAGQQP